MVVDYGVMTAPTLDTQEDYQDLNRARQTGYVPPPERQRTIDDFNLYLRKVESELFELHGVWYQISLWKHGLQYTHYDFIAGSPVIHSDPKNPRVRATYNILNAVQKQLMAYFIQAQPRWEARAVTPDGEKIEASKAASYVLRHFAHHCNIEAKIAEAADWLTTLGNAVIYCGWDPYSGDLWNGMSAEGIPLGDWELTVVPPYQMIVDPEARNVDEVRRVGRRRRVWRDTLVEKFPDKAPYIHDEEIAGIDTLASYEMAWLRMSHRHGLYTSGLQYLPPGRNMVTVYEWWEKPSPMHPQGRYFSHTRDGVDLELGPNPYGNRIPFAFAKHIPVEGSFWGRGVLHDLLFIQTEINRRESQKSEHCNLTGNPPLLHFSGDGFRKHQYTNMPGQIIELNPHNRHPGMLPHYMRTPDLSMTVREMVPEAMKFVDFISQQFGPSRGEQSSQVRSGVQQMMMQEADAMSMNTYMGPWEATWEHVFKLALYNFQMFAQIPRKLRVLGSNGEWRIQYLSAEDLLEDTDVEVIPGSTTPQSKSANFTQLLALLQSGAFNLADPSDNQKFWEMLDMGDASRIVSDKKLDLEKAQRAIAKIRMGVRPYFDPIIDNPQVHLDAISSFMKSGEFETLPDMVKMQALVYRATILTPIQGFLNTPAAPDMTGGAFPMMPGGAEGGPPEGGGGPQAIGPQNAGPAPEDSAPMMGPEAMLR